MTDINDNGQESITEHRTPKEEDAGPSRKRNEKGAETMIFLDHPQQGERELPIKTKAERTCNE